MDSYTTDIAKTFRQILYRDVFYVISGVVITTYFSEHFEFGNTLGQNDSSIIATIVYIGLCLAIGLVNQEIWSQVGLVTTTINRLSYPGICVWAYERHTRKPWKDRDPDKKIDVSGAWAQELWIRIIDLKQIGSSISACLFTVTVLSIGAAIKGKESCSLVVYYLIAAIVFAGLCWVKTMQQAAFELEEIPD